MCCAVSLWLQKCLQISLSRSGLTLPSKSLFISVLFKGPILFKSQSLCCLFCFNCVSLAHPFSELPRKDNSPSLPFFSFLFYWFGTKKEYSFVTSQRVISQLSYTFEEGPRSRKLNLSVCAGGCKQRAKLVVFFTLF